MPVFVYHRNRVTHRGVPEQKPRTRPAPNALHGFQELQQMVEVDFHDPHADPEEMKHEYDLTMAKKINTGYDAIVLAVAHDEFKKWDESYFLSIATPNALFADLKSICKNKISKLTYWSL